MLPKLDKVRGVHPGAVLDRELKLRRWENKQLALSIGEYPQTLQAVRRGARGITPALSIKLGHALGVDDAYFMLLQAYYEVAQKQRALSKTQATPDLGKLRMCLFWDTDIHEIDWNRQRKAVIRRVLERGNEAEIQEILSFYGKETVEKELEEMPKLTGDVQSFKELLFNNHD